MNPPEPLPEYTPGPWSIAEVRISGLSQPVIISHDWKICTLPALSNCGGNVNERAAQIAANAHLIAMAPELLEACELALSTLMDCAEAYDLNLSATCEKLNSIISKADPVK